mgnify:CR=1 FL=1
MNLWLTFRLSLSRIAAAKVRSGLTMLGIIIGVGAVVALTAVGQGAQQGIDDSLASLGANQITVSSTTTTGLEEVDAEAIEGIEGVLQVSTQVNSRATASYGSESILRELWGCPRRIATSQIRMWRSGRSCPHPQAFKTLEPLWCQRKEPINWASPRHRWAIPSG